MSPGKVVQMIRDTHCERLALRCCVCGFVSGINGAIRSHAASLSTRSRDMSAAIQSLKPGLGMHALAAPSIGPTREQLLGGSGSLEALPRVDARPRALADFLARQDALEPLLATHP